MYLIPSKGQRQQQSEFPNPPAPPVCDNPMDVVFLLDISHGLCNNNDMPYDECNNWNLVKRFTTDIIQAMPIGPNNVNVAMILYGSAVYEEWGLTR